jgi:hypothetical protein
MPLTRWPLIKQVLGLRANLEVLGVYATPVVA